MKKFTAVILFAIIVTCTQTISKAIQTRNIEEQKELYKNTQEQALTLEKNSSENFDLKFNALAERYIKNFRNCEQIHINDYINFFGLKISFNFDINGWQNNKCSYNLTGRIDSIGNDIKEIFELNIPDEKISQIVPQIKCDFSKDELNILVDGIIARKESELVQINNTLKNPTDKYQEKRTLTKEEEKMIKMLTNGTTCTIPNTAELIQKFSELTTQQDL